MLQKKSDTMILKMILGELKGKIKIRYINVYNQR